MTPISCASNVSKAKGSAELSHFPKNDGPYSRWTSGCGSCLLCSVSKAPATILFDAKCVLCSLNAQFVLRYDYRRRFRLASMQTQVGAALFEQHGIDPANPDTILLIDGDQVLRDSDAVLAIYMELGWPWRAAGWFRVVPRFVRDPIYRLVARNRYRLFGRRETCWVPRPEDRDRLL